MVKRYDKIVSTNSDGYITYMREQSDGAYVLYEDYEALEQKLAESEARNAELVGNVNKVRRKMYDHCRDTRFSFGCECPCSECMFKTIKFDLSKALTEGKE